MAGRKEHDRTKLTCFRISYLNRKERQRTHSMTFLDDDPDGYSAKVLPKLFTCLFQVRISGSGS